MQFGATTGAPPQQAELKDYGASVLTPPVQITLVYLKNKNIFTKPSGEKVEQGYSATGLVNKQDSETLSWFAQLITSYGGVQDLGQLKSHPFVNGMRPWEWNDGDAPDKAEYSGYKGHWFFKATSTLASLVDNLGDPAKCNLWTTIEMDGTPCEMRPIKSFDEIYNGCICNMIICCAEYNETGKVKFYLNGLCKVGKGEQWASGNQTRQLLGVADKIPALQGVPMQQPAYGPPAATAAPVQYAPPPQMAASGFTGAPAVPGMPHMAPPPPPAQQGYPAAAPAPVQQYAPPQGAPGPQGFAPQPYAAQPPAPQAPAGFAPPQQPQYAPPVGAPVQYAQPPQQPVYAPPQAPQGPAAFAPPMTNGGFQPSVPAGARKGSDLSNVLNRVK